MDIKNDRWAVGFNDRGHGHGDYAVLVDGSQEIVVKAPSQEVAEHIVSVHNAYVKYYVEYLRDSNGNNAESR